MDPISIPRARTLARIVEIIVHNVRAVIPQLALAQVKAPPRSPGRRARRRRFCRTAKHAETDVASVSISGQMAGSRRFWTPLAQWIARWVAFACSTPPPRSPRALVLLHRTVLASPTEERHIGPFVCGVDRKQAGADQPYRSGITGLTVIYLQSRNMLRSRVSSFSSRHSEKRFEPARG